jgi:hypothetical protein
VVGRRRLGLCPPGQSSVLWCDGNVFAAALRDALAEADRPARATVECYFQGGGPVHVRLGSTPSGGVGLLLPRWRTPLWFSDGSGLAVVLGRAQDEANRRVMR